MTSSDSPRLDRLEALSETILLAIQQQQTQISDLRASAVDCVTMIGTLGNEMHEMQAEIRGLQTENRRILEILQQRD
jgi:hypothetical protein